MTARIICGSQTSLAVTDPSSIGECRRIAKRMAEGFNFDEATTGRICIVATELATNIQRHAGAGTLLLQVLDDGLQPEFELLAIDRGPGMVDVNQCMRDGFSTAGTAGTGLGAISRQSKTFDLFSCSERGTVVLSRVSAKHSGPNSRAARNASLELGAISVAVAGEIECGDAWRIAEDDATVGIMIADGLGHGALAASASSAAAAAFVLKPFDPPSTAMTTFHRVLSGSRGAAAACALLHPTQCTIDYAGVGNISGMVVTGERARGMVSHNGTLGLQLLRAQQFEYAWPAGSTIVMHSDGLSARWNLANYPGLGQRHCAIIAGILYRDFGRPRDDATVLVLRYQR
ncbi:MAG TPA: ATP-binding SpoIIE family protein phosphatase [Steroidobacteraceae bacterium]